MAISYVGGVVAGRAGNSNSTVDVSLSSGLTGGSNSGVSAGDLVVVTVCTGSQARSSVVAVTAPATYQNLTAQRTTATTYDTNIQVSYKFMPSTPDSVVTIPAQGNIADGQAYVVQVFRGVDPTTPLDVTPTYATGSDANPKPAAITPVTAGTWIVVTGGGASAIGIKYTASYLTNFLAAVGVDTNDARVGAGYYTAWTSGEYDPAAFGSGLSDSWGATTIALRPASETQTLTPNLYSNTNSFYSPTVTQTLNANRYDNSNTFYAPDVSVGAVTLNADLFTNGNTFYQPTVNRGSVTLSASIYSNTNEFYAANVTLGAVNLNPELFTNTNEFYGHTLDVGTVNIAPDLFVNVNEFYQSNVTVGAVTLTASLFENTNAVYQHNVSVVTPNQNLIAELFVNANKFYAPNLQVGVITLSLEIFVNHNELYAPSITNVFGQNLIAELFVNANVFYGVNIDFAKYAYARRDSSITNVEVRENVQTLNRLNNVSGANRKLSVSFRQPNVVKSRR